MSDDHIPLCPEAEYRDTLTDGEFWDYVLNDVRPDDPPPMEPEFDAEDFEAMGTVGSPCPECGQFGACGYDADGRAYVHVTEDDDA